MLLIGAVTLSILISSSWVALVSPGFAVAAYSAPEDRSSEDGDHCLFSVGDAGRCSQTDIVPASAHILPGKVTAAPEGAGFDDYFEIFPPGAGEIGVVGETAEVENRLAASRSTGELLFVSGSIHCKSADYAGCQLIVTDVQDFASLLEAQPPPRPARGLPGVVVAFKNLSSHPGQLFFVQYARFPLVYAIGSIDAVLQDRLIEIANTCRLVFVSGDIGFSSSVILPYLEAVSLSADETAGEWELSQGELQGLESSLVEYLRPGNIRKLKPGLPGAK